MTSRLEYYLVLVMVFSRQWGMNLINAIFCTIYSDKDMLFGIDAVNYVIIELVIIVFWKNEIDNGFYKKLYFCHY